MFDYFLYTYTAIMFSMYIYVQLYTLYSNQINLLFLLVLRRKIACDFLQYIFVLPKLDSK